MEKTYWHLLEKKRMPTEYEVATSKLLYYTGRGFEVDVPLQEWYRTYQEGSPFTSANWEDFQDPQELTYTQYTRIQNEKETFVDGILDSIEESGYDFRLSKEWISVLSRFFAPLRYPCHAFQMVACYMGQMAPSGRIVVASLFQAANDVRRIQRIAYRMRQLQEVFPDFGKDSKFVWEKDPSWQPCRETLEKLLVTYDWGEAFTALNLVIKPMWDDLWMVHFGALAGEYGDPLLAEIFFSLRQDCRWQREWSKALVQSAIKNRSSNKECLQGWIRQWVPLAEKALKPFSLLFENSERKSSVKSEEVYSKMKRSYAEYLQEMDLTSPRDFQENDPKRVALTVSGPC